MRIYLLLSFVIFSSAFAAPVDDETPKVQVKIRRPTLRKRNDIVAQPPKEVVPILKQVHEINADGSYTFGYEAGDGSFRVETKDANGYIKGKYGYVDLEGRTQVIEYVAGKEAGQSVGFIPSGPLVSAPVSRSSVATSAEQRMLDYQYSSVDDDEDGYPDLPPGKTAASASTENKQVPSSSLPAVARRLFDGQQSLAQQQQQQRSPLLFPVFGGRIPTSTSSPLSSITETV